LEPIVSDPRSTYSRTTNGEISTDSGPSTIVRRRPLVAGILFIALTSAAIGSLGAPLITKVAQTYHVSLATAQWTLTGTLVVGAVATPMLGKLGNGLERRRVVLSGLAVVVAGSVLTVVPAGRVGLGVLIVGRATQGVGFGLTALMMSTARDHLDAGVDETISLLAVAGTVGVGFGYPIAGLLAEHGGVRAAYAVGLAFVVAAWLVAYFVVPDSRSRDRTPPVCDAAPTVPGRTPVDFAGAVLLSLGLVLVLLVTSLPRLWINTPFVASAVLVSGFVVLWLWAGVERRAREPIVDIAALRNPVVAGANLITVAAGSGTYILFTLVTRYSQVPPSVGYGFGLDGFQAGLVILPFSIVGFMAGRAVDLLFTRITTYMTVAVNAVVMAGGSMLFALDRSSTPLLVTAIALLGGGVGGLSATVPRIILAVTARDETARAMSVNQVLRYTSFSLGSAVSALVLAAFTPARSTFPTREGYTAAAWIAVGVDVMCVLLVFLLAATDREGQPHAVS
jgi:MFS family permease